MQHEFYGHVRGDRWKWIVSLVAFIMLAAAVVAMGVKVASMDTVGEVRASAYGIGLIDEEGENDKGDEAIYLKDAIPVKDLKIEVAKKADIEYKLFFYDEDGDFLSASEALTVDLDPTIIPEDADTVRIMITPLEDKDGEVDATEKVEYAEQLTVTYTKK